MVLPVALYVAGAFVFFRWQIFSKFDLLFGDRGDARLIIFLHEHVYQSLWFRNSVLSPPFFYDLQQTLGYSEAFLLNQVVYAPLRLLGTDPYLALSLVVVVLSVVSFTCAYLFLRRLGVSSAIAAVGALVITFPNNLYVKSGHLQHFAVYYLPVVAWSSAVAIGEVHTRRRRAYVSAAVAGGVAGMVFSTGYYVAWFFGLGLVVLAVAGFGFVRPVLRDWWREGRRDVQRLLSCAALAFAAAMVVFVVVYAPALARGATRTLVDYLFYAPRLEDLFNVGNGNLIWSKPIAVLGLVSAKRRAFEEATIALTPIMQALLLVCAALAVRPGFWPATARGRIARALAFGGLCVCALFFVLTVKVNGLTLFKWVQILIPGATAIRVGYRAMVVGNLFAMTAIAVTFDRIVCRALAEPGALLRAVRIGVAGVLLAMVAIEQINVGQSAFVSRTFERAHLARLDRAPSTCRTFFVAPQPGRQWFEVQMDAMMIAMALRLPTINGYSGFMPPGWELYDTNAPDYESLAMKWARARGLEGLCRVDVIDGTWTTVP